MPHEMLANVLALLQQIGRNTPPTIPDMRNALEAAAAFFPSTGQSTPVDMDGVRGEWVVASAATDERVVIFLHGGAYVLGSVNSHRALMGRISAATGARVLGVEYRRAPEHPFPAAVEDADAAYRWLLRSGWRAERVAIGGDSAGAALALSTAITARSHGIALPACVFCLCPWVDLECESRSWRANAAREPILRHDSLLEMAGLYLAGRDPRTPLAAPLYAELSGLPPLLVQAGGADVLLDDAHALVARARLAGVNVELRVWEEMFHVWHSFAQLPEAAQAVDQIGEFVRKHTA